MRSMLIPFHSFIHLAWFHPLSVCRSDVVLNPLIRTSRESAAESTAVGSESCNKNLHMHPLLYQSNHLFIKSEGLHGLGLGRDLDSVAANTVIMGILAHLTGVECVGMRWQSNDTPWLVVKGEQDY